MSNSIESQSTFCFSDHFLLMPGDDCSHLLGIKQIIMHTGKKCVVRYCGADNWFDARSKCRSKQMRLSTSALNYINKSIMKFWLTKSGSCGRLWLGLHKEDWYHQNKHGGL